MLSQLPVIYFFLDTVWSNILLLISYINNNNFLVGAIFSSVSLLISNHINNNFQLKREREQRIWQAETDRQKWYREKIYESYIRAINILTKLIVHHAENKILGTEFDNDNIITDNDNIIIDNDYITDKEVHYIKLTWEFLSEFDIIIASYPDKETEQIKEKVAEIYNNLDEAPTIVRKVITELMELDSRIKCLNNDNSTIIKK